MSPERTETKDQAEARRALRAAMEEQYPGDPVLDPPLKRGLRERLMLTGYSPISKGGEYRETNPLKWSVGIICFVAVAEWVGLFAWLGRLI